MSGRRLNELLEAVRARTPLNAAQSASGGWTGVVAEGGSAAPPPLSGTFAPGQMHVLTPAFLRRLNAALTARTPNAASEAGAAGFQIRSAKPGAVTIPRAAPAKPTRAALGTLAERLRAITPRQAAQRGPQGYRLNAAAEKTAGLRVDTELRAGYARVCYAAVDDADTVGFVIVRTVTLQFENGSYTETYTASGEVIGYPPGDPPAAPCAEVNFSTTLEEGLNYGAFESQTLNDADVVPPGEAAAAAAENLGLLAETTAEHAWQEGEFRAISATPRADYLGTASSQSGLSSPNWTYSRPRFRLTNTGQVRLKATVEWTVGMDGEPTGAATTEDITLRPGEASEWINAPHTTPGTYADGIVKRVRVGRFLSLP